MTSSVPSNAASVSGNPWEPNIAAYFSSIDEYLESYDSKAVEVENRLAVTRLGVAGSLFLALRAHHPPTARHSLRVALSVSAWATVTDLTAPQRDELEVAALLHDVGKVGVPDQILRHPGSLTPDQVAIIDKARQHTMSILSACCVSQEMLAGIEHVEAWYDGSRHGFRLSGSDIPVLGRMIAVANVFDIMTTERVYRKAIPVERALAELCTFAGTQFDPSLVEHFVKLQTIGQGVLIGSMSDHWLTELSQQDSNQFWSRQPGLVSVDALYHSLVPFHDSLLKHVPGGVIFVEANMSISRWNKSLELLTGIPADVVQGSLFEPAILQLADEHGKTIQQTACPVRYAIVSQTRVIQTMEIKSLSGRVIPVEVQCIPVMPGKGVCLGAAVVLRDLSLENRLEQRVHSLHIKATHDPLTHVANRAEFDRVHTELIDRSTQTAVTFSLIICDVDRFKQVNDEHGHQAGDEALVSFAALLQQLSRKQDLVARYGGEEFVMLCPECTCADATHLAEKIRLELSQTSLAELGGQCVTASFGVTEFQSGDTPESMLRRADRGLLQAKDLGRNMVIQLGGPTQTAPSISSNWFSHWWQRSQTEILLERCLSISVPVNVAVQKLRGFIADHDAELLAIDENRVELRISSTQAVVQRRQSDRPLPLLVRLEFNCRAADERRPQQTMIRVKMQLQRQRDRRQKPAQHARGILRSLMSYLVACECPPEMLQDGNVQPMTIEKLLRPVVGSRS